MSLFEEVQKLKDIQEDQETNETSLDFDYYNDMPATVGRWNMSSVQVSTGNARDVGGGVLTLLRNGTPTYNIDNVFLSYIDFNGSTDFIVRPDEPDFQITGLETIYDSSVRGLTIGGLFFFDRLGVNEQLMGKFTGGGGFAYRLIKLTDNKVNMQISVDGSATAVIAANLAVTTGKWFSIIGRFTPSSSVSLFLDGDEASNTTAIPASIFNSPADFRIGTDSGGFGQELDGRAARCFLSSNSLPTNYIKALAAQELALVSGV